MHSHACSYLVPCIPFPFSTSSFQKSNSSLHVQPVHVHTQFQIILTSFRLSTHLWQALHMYLGLNKPHTCRSCPFLASFIPEIHSFHHSMPCVFFTFPEFAQTIHFWQIPLTCCSKDTCILIKQNTSLQILSMPCVHYLRNTIIPSLMHCHLS